MSTCRRWKNSFVVSEGSHAQRPNVSTVGTCDKSEARSGSSDVKFLPSSQITTSDRRIVSHPHAYQILKSPNSNNLMIG